MFKICLQFKLITLIILNYRKFILKPIKISNIREKIRHHISYENDTFAWEVNKDELAFGTRKIRKMIEIGKEKLLGNSHSVSKMFKVVEGTRSFPLSWLMKRSTFLIDSFNKFLMECEQHGFTDYLYKSQFIDVPPPSTKPDPQKLTMDILSAGFYVWLATVLAACVVFIIEHIVAYITRRP